jgi:hypothetical protein
MRRIVSGVLVAGLLTGCGVRTTGVVDAGEPAGGVPSGGSVYLTGPNGLLAVSRMGLSSGDVQTAVEALLAGPDDAERAAGYTTELPEGVTLVALESTARGVAVRLSVDPNEFSSLALAQLSCTIAAYPTAKIAEVPVVAVDGAGGKSVFAPDCPVL